MIRTAVSPRPVRVAASLAGVAGVFALAGCTGAATTVVDSEPPAPAPDAATSQDAATGSGSTYADGTYTAEGSYATPESVETISVTVTLEDDIVTEVEVVGDPQKRESEEYQGRFIGGIADVVVGQDIDSLSVSRVAGSSLTSGGFNRAIEAIMAEAAA